MNSPRLSAAPHRGRARSHKKPRRWFARRLQGFTGDCLGATQQVSEIGFYLGAALSLRWP